MVVCGFRAGEEVSVSGGHGGRGVGDGGRDWVGIWKAEQGREVRIFSRVWPACGLSTTMPLITAAGRKEGLTDGR